MCVVDAAKKPFTLAAIVVDLLEAINVSNEVIMYFLKDLMLLMQIFDKFFD